MTLNFMSATVGMFDNVAPPERNVYDSHGEWATDALRTRVQAVDDKLTPSRLEALRPLVLVLKEEMAKPEMKELLAKRKELYDGWSEKKLADRSRAAQDANRITRDIVQHLTDAVFQAGEGRGDIESKTVAQNIMLKLGSFVPNF